MVTFSEISEEKLCKYVQGFDIDIYHVQFITKICFVKLAEKTVSGIVYQKINVLAAALVIQFKHFIFIGKITWYYLCSGFKGLFQLLKLLSVSRNKNQFRTL